MEKLDTKKIAILIPNYIGGGAEKISDTLFAPIMREYGYTIDMISVDMNDHTRPRAKAVGYNVIDLSECGPDFREPKAAEAILDALKNSNAKHIVYVGMAPKEIERYRRELPGRNIIFHLHTMPAWEPRVRVLGTKRYVQALESVSKYIEWYFVKYLKEKWFKVYTHRIAKQYRKIYDNVDSFIALTDSYRQQLNRMIGKRSNKSGSNVSTIYNPFDPTDLLPLASHPKHKEILYMGRLHCIEKGIEHLLRAWKFTAQKHPDWKLKIVGEGPDKGYLEYIIRTLDIPRVEFHGYSEHPEEHYATASILCLTSNMEGWPTVLSEAMAAGVVPIAFDCSGGVREQLDNGRGILVPRNKDKQLSKALSYLIDHPEKREEMRKLFPDFVTSFRTDIAVRQFLNLIEKNGHA